MEWCVVFYHSAMINFAINRVRNFGRKIVVHMFVSSSDILETKARVHHFALKIHNFSCSSSSSFASYEVIFSAVLHEVGVFSPLNSLVHSAFNVGPLLSKKRQQFVSL